MIRRAGPPEPDLFEAIVDSHGGALWSVALSCSRGDRGAAEELVQETLVRAWQHPEALDGSRGSARAWLLTVLRRLAIDEARRRQRRPLTVPGDGIGGETAHGQPATAEPLGGVTDGGVDRLVDSWLVRAALERLTPEHRTVLELVVGGDLPIATAADVLGVPTGTVKSRLFYALRALRLVLEEMDDVG